MSPFHFTFPAIWPVKISKSFLHLCTGTATSGCWQAVLGVLSNFESILRGDIAYRFESVKPSIDWVIKRLAEVVARSVYNARRWYVHVASAFPLARC